MVIRAIPIPIQGDSHSFPFPIVSSIPIPVGIPSGNGNPIPARAFQLLSNLAPDSENFHDFPKCLLRLS